MDHSNAYILYFRHKKTMEICPKCHTTEEHDFDTCDGKPGVITVRWYTYTELEEIARERDKNKVYYVKVKRPHTR